jgi:hypothetical protein
MYWNGRRVRRGIKLRKGKTHSLSFFLSFVYIAGHRDNPQAQAVEFFLKK